MVLASTASIRPIRPPVPDVAGAPHADPDAGQTAGANGASLAGAVGAAVPVAVLAPGEGVTVGAGPQPAVATMASSSTTTGRRGRVMRA
jgi:hypothetical protein